MTEIERDTRWLHGQPDGLLDFEDPAFQEPVGVEELSLLAFTRVFFAIFEERHPQMPTPRDVY
ncbi:MAG TPA: hypothetical protein VEZ71_31760, partial [Archangium sp.]|nr:hypothetical protein [Archangium sp.]